MSKKYLAVINGDMNDADYKSIYHEIDEETVVLFRKVASAIEDWQKENKNNRHNWDSTEYSKLTPYEAYKDVLTEQEIDIFNDYIPSGGDYPVYMIEELVIYDFINKEVLI